MMNPSIVSKLESLLERHEELQHMLSDAEVISVQEKFRNFSKEYSELEPVVLCFRQLQQAKSNMAEAELLQKDSDADLRAMAADEIASSSKRIRATLNRNAGSWKSSVNVVVSTAVTRR